MIELKKTEHIANSAVKLTIEVSADKTQEVYNDIIAEYAKGIEIPGFRKGKIPKDVILRKVGNNIRMEAAAKIVDEAWKYILDNNNIQPISQPTLINMPEMDIEKPFSFEITYDVYPEFEIANYKDFGG